MSDKNIAHKQLIVAKCYKLALGAMYYLDRIMKAANRWEEAESSAKSEKDSYERNR